MKETRNPIYKSCEVRAELNGVGGWMWDEYYSESNREDYKCFFRPYGSDKAVYLPDSDNTENLFWQD